MKISIYIVKSRLNSAGKVAIKCRITYNKQRKDFSTGLFINPDYWKSNQIQIIMKIKNSSAFFSKRFNIFILLIMITGQNFTIAQVADEECYVTTDQLFTPQVVPHSASIDPNDLDNYDTVVFNIYFWQVNDPNGDFNNPYYPEITENLALEAVANLNIAFNSYDIFFKYRGVGEMDSPVDVPNIRKNPSGDCETLGYPDIDGWNIIDLCQVNDLREHAYLNGYMNDDTFNVYVVNSTYNFAGAASYNTAYPVVSAYVLTHPNVLAHEIGHCFDLLHTFENYTDPDICEQVERNPNVTCDPTNPEMPCYNANVAGDIIPDTSAMPDFANEYCVLNDPTADCSSGDTTNYRFRWIDDCSYSGFNSDCKETEYIIFDEDVANYMSYSPSECRNTFTVGQVIRMRETIEWNLGNRWSDRETTISALYEPYTGEYYESGPAQDPHDQPLFQPGFDYIFYACSCENQDGYDCVNGPCDYDENNFQSYTISIKEVDKEESDYSSITHPNHSSIYIAQLDDVGNRRCYDNFNKSASFGSVTQFNDGVFNTNVTIQAQDSTQINNPSLIDNLDAGLYVIDKTYDDGTTNQSVILKENNE